jgi:hypothetical protein
VSADYNEAADHIVRKAATLQETRAPGTLLARCGGGRIFAAQDLARALHLVGARTGRGDCRSLFAYAVRAQIVRDARRAVLARQAVRPRFGVALVGKLLVPDQTVQQPCELFGGLGVRRQFARQLGAGVFPPSEQAQGPRLQLRRRIRTVSPACAPAQ